jgi:hypothetical protein
MRRSITTFGLAWSLTLLAGCGQTGDRPPESAEATVAPSTGDAAPEPMLAWSFGDAATTEAGDVDVEFSGGYEFVGNAVTFNGRNGFGTSVVPAPVNTTASFSVSAWVSAADPVQYATAVSQVGTEAASFYLGFGESGWGFAMKDADTNEPGHTIRATGDPQLVDIGEWTHLVGVHDLEEGQIRLYVNGVLGDAVAFNQPWQGEGELTIGRSQAHFAQADFWPGSIASVAIYSDALTTEQVRSIHEASQPTGARPTGASRAGALTGTWDHVLDEAGREAVLEGFREEGLVDSADEVAVRIGFDGNDWWQGNVFDGELFLLHGVPEGDGGSFFLVPGEPLMVLLGASDEGHVVIDWKIEGEALTLTAVEVCVGSGAEMTCTEDRSEMDPVALSVMEHTFMRSGDDPSY